MSLKNSSVKTKIHKLFRNKLNNKKINKIYKKFENSLNINESFIVAVSGGPDSLALAFLSKIYSIKNKLVSKFYIVDHRLRNESTNEAKIVRKILGKYSINAQILSWHGPKPSNNIQSVARNKRYELLFKECKKLNIKNILLGHHQDDLFENFFIRIFRGSGLKGLISLDKKTAYNGVNLLRPLLDQKKDDLIYLSKKIFDFYIDDPSNKDEKFKRIKIRKLLDELKKNGLSEENFYKTIKNLKSSDTVVNFYVSENLDKNSFFSTKKNHFILNDNFFKQPDEVVFRSFSNSLKLVSKKYYPVRGKKLDNIIKKIKYNEFSKETLGGCIIEKVKQSVIISKEHKLKWK